MANSELLSSPQMILPFTKSGSLTSSPARLFLVARSSQLPLLGTKADFMFGGVGKTDSLVLEALKALRNLFLLTSFKKRRSAMLNAGNATSLLWSKAARSMDGVKASQLLRLSCETSVNHH